MKKSRSRVDAIFGERILLFLSTLAVPLLLIDIFTPLNPIQQFIIQVIDWGIIAVFFLEYLSKLYAADSKSLYVRNGWNMLSIIIIVLPFFGLITSSYFLFYSPVLRMLRVTRILLFTVKAGGEARALLPNTVLVTIPAELLEGWEKLREKYEASDEDLAYLLLKNEVMKTQSPETNPYLRLESAGREIEQTAGLEALDAFSREVELLGKKLVERQT